MGEKQLEVKEPVEQEMVKKSENLGVAALFIETVWGQYEQSLTRGNGILENQEDVLINAMKEVNKFNKQYRKSLTGLYQQTKETNNEILKEIMDNLPLSENKTYLDPELSDKIKVVADQMEAFALTPAKFAIDFIEKLEDSMEKDAESYISFAREQRNEWQKIADEYVNIAKGTSQAIIERSMEGFNVLGMK